MGERADAGPHLAERLDARPRLTRINVIGAAYRQRMAIAFRQDDAGWPHFHVDFVDLAWRELLLLVVGVIGSVGQRELGVELAVRAAQPALRDRGMRIERALEGNLL